MERRKTCDIFITHAWRYHDDWKRLVALLDEHDPHCWRNFSLPWFDPALKPGSEFGGKVLRESLEGQVIPAHAVVLLAGVYEQLGSRKWIDFEIEAARKHGKRIIAMPASGSPDLPPEVRALAHDTCGWDVRELLRKAEAAGVPQPQT